MTRSSPPFSVVINTNGRRDALKNTLNSLQFVDYPSFEVIVVYGPTPDGTKEMLQTYDGQIKVAPCPERNLSASRNIGIAMAAGEIIAFIDDDALPEAEWLHDLAAGYDDERVAASGGIVYDHTGTRFQYMYTTADRLGNAKWDLTEPAAHLNFPLSNNFPYLQGTNTSFRLDRLLQVGGFDEEIEFYLDETDVCCRLIDAGYHIRQLPGAIVHHKFLPSHVRNVHKVTKDRYAVLKNKIYFSIVNNHGHYSLKEVIEDAQRFIASHIADAERHFAADRLTANDMTKLTNDVNRAWERGLRVGLTRQRRLMSAEQRSLLHTAFREFPRTTPVGGRKVYCLFSQEFPPKSVGGIGTYTRNAATALASMGHHVHVLTRADSDATVDFEDGAWVHRLPVKGFPSIDKSHGLEVPAHIWNYSNSMLEEVYKIARKRTVDCVEAPIWDCEGIAVVVDGRFPQVVSLHTTLGIWLKSHVVEAQDERYMRDFGRPMLAVERYMFDKSVGIHANSNAIVEEIDTTYDMTMDGGRTVVIHHGIEDPASLDATRLEKIPGTLHVLFVGRLEERKGIDVLLRAIEGIARKMSNVIFDIVGDDKISWRGGQTLKDLFTASEPSLSGTVVKFHGKVSDADLRGFFTRADIVVVPSRFESFGLTAVEGFAFGKPVIASRTGGLAEVLMDGEAGFLVEPGDTDALQDAIERLLRDGDLRQRFADTARWTFETRFTAMRMARDMQRLFAKVGRTSLPASAIVPYGPTKPVHLWNDEVGVLLNDGTRLRLEVPASEVFLTFWRHPWSGVVRVSEGQWPLAEFDLFSTTPGLSTFKVEALKGTGSITVSRTGRKSDSANGTEVIFYAASVAHRQRALPRAEWEIEGAANDVELWDSERGILLSVKTRISLPEVPGVTSLNFWRHPWSGFVRITRGTYVQEADLFSPVGDLVTIVVPDAGEGRIDIERAMTGNPESHGTEVIFYSCSVAG